MNLLTKDWLPLRMKNGQTAYRPPSAIADPDVVDLALPRADFQGAAYQWLIGLLQTAAPAHDYTNWINWFAEPPTVDELEHAFAPFAAAFELDGEGPRFMQDIDPLEDAKPSPVSGLLIDAPGANGIKNNTDHFVKRGRTEAICADCSALALFTLQINAPSGGAGYRVGLRGGGPLTTLVLPDEAGASLWHRLWLNVTLPQRITQPGQTYAAVSVDDATIFPWMGPTRVSDKKGSEVLPDAMHPLHAYWSMPRRFRLCFEQAPCRCDLCGREVSTSVREVRAKNYGANYDGPWQHPLTPYRRDPKKPNEPPLSLKGQPGGLGYRHWSPLVLPDPEESGALPAMVVHDFMTQKVPVTREARDFGDDVEALIGHPRLWAFGYDMDNMKPKGWYSVEMPLVAVPADQQERLRDWVQRLTELSRQMAGMTRSQIKHAWFSRPGDTKGDLSALDKQFYEATQGEFYRALGGIQQALVDGARHVPTPVVERWYRSLRREALRLFEIQALGGPIEELDMKRIVRARRQLLYWLAGSGKGGKIVADFAKWGAVELRSVAETLNEEATP